MELMELHRATSVHAMFQRWIQAKHSLDWIDFLGYSSLSFIFWKKDLQVLHCFSSPFWHHGGIETKRAGAILAAPAQR
jgi:hypothetical protein